MRKPFLPSRFSRRDFGRLFGIGLTSVCLLDSRSAYAQSLLKPVPLLVFPKVGDVRIAGVNVTVNNVKPPNKPSLQVGISQNQGACTLELAVGINIVVEVDIAISPGSHPYLGELGFVQFTQYTHQRAPSGLTGVSNNYACARSGGRWELDSNDPYKPYVPCVLGRNTVRMGDDPGVPTEDTTAYDTVFVGPKGPAAPDHFRTWLVWQETDDNKPVSPANKAKRHPLARIDWAWSGRAIQGPAGATCPSQLHPGLGWSLQGSSGAVTGVFVGPLAGAPPAKYIRAHNTTWIAGPC
jgi:hypothetical protein